MGKKGLLIAYAIAPAAIPARWRASRRHGHPAGRWGSWVKDCTCVVGGPRAAWTFCRFPPTCALPLRQAHRSRGEASTCQHCMAACISYGEVSELAQTMEITPKSVLFAALVALLRVRSRAVHRTGTAWDFDRIQVEPGAGEGTPAGLGCLSARSMRRHPNISSAVAGTNGVRATQKLPFALKLGLVPGLPRALSRIRVRDGDLRILRSILRPNPRNSGQNGLCP